MPDALADALRSHVARLAAAPRPSGSAAHRQAADYIQTRLQQAGFAVERQAFPGGVNLLTRPAPDGDGLPLLVIAAHYDSVPGSPGADDNASAVAALLELAAWAGPRLAAARGLKARLLLAAYDQEEGGLLGSAHHSRQLSSPLLGMISLEMLGYTDARPGGQQLPPHLKGLYPDVGDFIGVVGNEASRRLAEGFTAGLKRVPGLPVQSLVVPGDGSALPVTRLSDHASFWDRGLPALMLTDTSFFRNPHYHQATDTPETLDGPFLAKVAEGVRLAVWDLLTAA